MNICYLSLGSNQKHPQRQIRNALRTLKNMPRSRLLRASGIYKTKAWGVQTQQDFSNAVAEIATTLPPALLLKHCQRIERRQGRVRRMRWGPRTLDIDIILYADRKIQSSNLTIPHPYFLSRDFVMMPLLELQPDYPFR